MRNTVIGMHVKIILMEDKRLNQRPALQTDVILASNISSYDMEIFCPTFLDTYIPINKCTFKTLLCISDL